MKLPKTYREGFTVYAVKNPRFSISTNEAITADVDWGGGFEPYSISPKDPEPWGKDLFIHCSSMNPAPFVGKTEEEYQAEFDATQARQDMQDELSDIMIDVQLQMATPEQIARAKELRLKLKE